MKKVSIIGGGAAALILAAELDSEKYQVVLYEKKKTVGRKFLVAGEGGLNLTYSAPLEELIGQYSPQEFMAPIIRKFSNEDWVNWLKLHGVSTFVGSSSRVFPLKDLKPIEVLNKIVDQLSIKEVEMQFEKQWTGWTEHGDLRFKDDEHIESDIVVFALGGASWKVTGSDGSWSTAFAEKGIHVHPFRAANCAFGVKWDAEFICTHAAKPLKNISLSYNGHYAKGELVISEFGLEGNAIYALSERLQEALLTQNSAVIHLDLKPTMSAERIEEKINRSGQSKMTEVLRKDLNLDRASIGLLKQFSDKETFSNADQVAALIKAIPVKIHAAAEIDEAISTLGGIALDEVDAHFQLNKLPNTYAIGEMLDWYAPTGGYLLQGCFSMGFVLAHYLNQLEDE